MHRLALAKMVKPIEHPQDQDTTIEARTIWEAILVAAVTSEEEGAIIIAEI
jgi:hypothetical protein